MVRTGTGRRVAPLLAACTLAILGAAAAAHAWPLAAALPLLAAHGTGSPAASDPGGGLALRDDDRILVLAPHPDDEVLGAGGVLGEAARRGLPVRVVFLTSGDSNEWSFLAWRGHPVVMPHAALAMGALREQEALAAAGALGVPASSLVFLGYPDHATLDIWRSSWGAHAPERAPLTRARAVPYANALRPGAPYRGESILADLEAVLRDFRPTMVFVSHPADRHPDHAALYLFARVALWDVGDAVQARLHPFLVHYEGWPLRHGDALAPPPALAGLYDWERRAVPAVDRDARRRALRLHHTQYHYSASRLLPLLRDNELYGDVAPLVLRDGDALRLRDAAPQADPVAGAASRAAERAPALVLQRTGPTLAVILELPHADDASPTRVALSGWRADRPFGTMPKLELRVGAHGWWLRDAVTGRSLASAAREPLDTHVVARLPLATLGGPQRLFVQTAAAEAASPWWTLELPAAGAAAP